MSVMDGAIIATVSTPELAVVTKTLSRRFGDLIAVANVSMAVSHGEIFGLIGPNGAGKSTLIKMLTTLLPPSSGTARVAGFDIVVQAAEVRRRIGYVPQLLSADRSLTGYENMLLSARLYAIPRRERAQRIAEALSAMNLTEAAGRLVHHYSGGMIRALEIRSEYAASSASADDGRAHGRAGSDGPACRARPGPRIARDARHDDAGDHS